MEEIEEVFVELQFPDSSQIINFNFTSKHTIDQVKCKLATYFSNLNEIDSDQVVIGVDKDNLFFNSHQSIAQANSFVKDLVARRKSIPLQLYIKDEKISQWTPISSQNLKENAEMSSIANKSRLAQHSFQLQTSALPRVCDHCNGFIWNDLYFCSGCKINAHKDCIEILKCSPCHKNLDYYKPNPMIFNPDKCGYLTKEGRINTAMKKRWFILKGDQLYYMHEPNAVNLLGTIQLQDSTIKIENKEKFSFLIYTKHRTFYLVADNEHELHSWVDLLNMNSKKDRESRRLERGISLSDIDNKKLSMDNVPWLKLPQIELLIPTCAPEILTKVCASPKYRKSFGLQFLDEITSVPRDGIELFRINSLITVFNSEENPTLQVVDFSIMQTTNLPIPPYFPEKFPVFFQFDKEISKSVQCSMSDTAYDALRKAITKLQQTEVLPNSIQFNNYVLKIVGREEYLLECSTPLNKLIYVRNCIKTKSRLIFSLIERTKFLEKANKKLLAYSYSPRLDIFGSAANAKKGFTWLNFESEICYPIHLIEEQFAFQIKKLATNNIAQYLYGHFDKSDVDSQKIVLFFETMLYYGNDCISPSYFTEEIRISKELDWSEWIRFPISFKDLPRETKICVILIARKSAKFSSIFSSKEQFRIPVASTILPISDVHGKLHSGIIDSRMKLGKFNLHSSILDYSLDELTLKLEFYKTPKPLLFVSAEQEFQDLHSPFNKRNSTKIKNIKRLEEIISSDCLCVLSESAKKFLWNERLFCKQNYPEALPKLMLAVPWKDHLEVKKAHKLLTEWPLISPYKALEMLGPQYPDLKVREYAVHCLRLMSDSELVDLLPILIQSLKHETYHHSSLGNFLLDRALNNKAYVGHFFFWHLHTELNNPTIYLPYALLLETYLSNSSSHLEQLSCGLFLMLKLSSLSEKIKTSPPEKRDSILKTTLEELTFPIPISLPYDPRIQVDGIFIDKCRWLDSNSFPIWIEFKNADPYAKPVPTIFKKGDDLRQDMLTLQMFKLMEQLWNKQSLDMHFTIYGCIATGLDKGLIEVVPDSKTTADIQKSFGGRSVTSAFKKTPIAAWLQENNPSPGDYQEAITKFTLSCSAYSVATYVLGIGDRHNDNIMVNKCGHMFHIDFAHFLGNVMTFASIKRETAPFVLTPEMVFVMGGEKGSHFQRYVELSTLIYNYIRADSNLFFILFTLMISTGISQLKSFEDIYYVKNAFALDKTNKEASNYFIDLIYESFRTKRTQLNNAIHIMAHPD